MWQFINSHPGMWQFINSHPGWAFLLMVFGLSGVAEIVQAFRSKVIVKVRRDEDE